MFLGDRYELQEPIVRNGMATVYRGRDTQLQRAVAIKILHETYSNDQRFLQRLQQRVQATFKLQHPNIVQLYDYGRNGKHDYIVMELVEGTDLRRYLRTHTILSVDRATIIAHDVALGLGAAHRYGSVHRGVSPQHILIGQDGEVKLTTFSMTLLGDVHYYAPEQAQGEITTPATDIYAFGVVMYQMLTGRVLFEGESPVSIAMQHIQDIPLPPSRLNPNIPSSLEEFILRCLEKVPEKRYRDGSQLAHALARLDI